MNPVTSEFMDGRWEAIVDDTDAAGRADESGAMAALRLDLDHARKERDDALALLERIRAERRGLDREIVELRATLHEAERQLANVRQTFIYRIGEALVSARSPQGILKLPSRLMQLRRAFLEKKRAEGGSVGELQIAARLQYVDEAMRILARDGLEAARDYLARLPAAHSAERARAMVEVAQTIRRENPREAGELALDAARLNPLERRLRNLALNLFEDGAVRVAAAIIERIEGQFRQPADRHRRETIHAFLKELESPFKAPTVEMTSLPVRNGKTVLGISSRSAPHDARAASWRLQSVLEGVTEAGYSALWLTEPGFRHPPGHEGAFDERQGALQVRRLPPTIAHPTAIRAFREEVADLIETELLAADVTTVYADLGDPMLATAALIAARRTGARFVADIGALPSARRTAPLDEREQVIGNLFRETVRGADEVIVRSETLKDLVARSTGRDALHVVHSPIPAERLVADAERVAQLGHELELEGRRVIGVLAVPNGDEGSADLVQALVDVFKAQPQTVVLFAGDGIGAQTLRLLAAGLGIGERVVFLSGAALHGPADILALSDVVVFPQREFDEEAYFLVPLAMKTGTPVVAANGAWVREVLIDGVTGWIAPSGDATGLADVLIQALGDAKRAARIAAAAEKSASALSDASLFVTRLMSLVTPAK